MKLAEAIEFLKEQGYKVIRKDKLQTLFMEQFVDRLQLDAMHPEQAMDYAMVLERTFAAGMGSAIAKELGGVLRYTRMPQVKGGFDAICYRAELTIVRP